MTSDEIKRTPAIDMSATAWMREVALQLAILNEKKGPGRPPRQKDEEYALDRN